jgi:hypothetical protein
LVLAGLMVVAALGWQQRSIGTLRRELAELRRSSGEPDAPVPRPAAAQASVTPRAPAAADDPSLAGRVLALEASVALLNQGAEHLMDRGAVPLSPAKTEELRGILLDPNRPTRDRLNALRLLRRNGLFTDDLAAVAAEWLGASTDADATRELLEQLRGARNAPLSAALQNLASQATDRRVREAALDSLRGFVQDPQVEALVSSLAMSDPSPELRRRAEDVLRRISVTPEGAASLAQRALNPAAPLDERLLSLRVLRRSDDGLDQIAPALAQTAQATADPEARLKLFTAFDEVNRPEFMLPLVEGVQDGNADVRRRAADALVDYRDHPTVQEWLRVLASSDPDPGVREQAARAFAPQPDPGRRRGDRPPRR